mmetsp:Transcript_69624/g.167075  ORF Transcript_69624/g.167075 Transcript_69624/m.167075 type:complete len:652 (-) Transcript_69624:46-2001(-)
MAGQQPLRLQLLSQWDWDSRLTVRASHDSACGASPGRQNLSQNSGQLVGTAAADLAAAGPDRSALAYSSNCCNSSDQTHNTYAAERSHSTDTASLNARPLPLQHRHPTQEESLGTSPCRSSRSPPSEGLRLSADALPFRTPLLGAGIRAATGQAESLPSQLPVPVFLEPVVRPVAWQGSPLPQQKQLHIPVPPHEEFSFSSMPSPQFAGPGGALPAGGQWPAPPPPVFAEALLSRQLLQRPSPERSALFADAPIAPADGLRQCQPQVQEQAASSSPRWLPAFSADGLPQRSCAGVGWQLRQCSSSSAAAEIAPPHAGVCQQQSSSSTAVADIGAAAVETAPVPQPAPLTYVDEVASLQLHGMALLADAFRYRSVLRLGIQLWTAGAEAAAQEDALKHFQLHRWQRLTHLQKKRRAQARQAAESATQLRAEKQVKHAFSQWVRQRQQRQSLQRAELMQKKHCFGAWREGATSQVCSRAYAVSSLEARLQESWQARLGRALRGWHRSWRRKVFVREASLAIAAHDAGTFLASAFAAWHAAAKANVRSRTRWMLRVDDFRRRRRRRRCRATLAAWQSLLLELRKASRAQLARVFACWRLWVEEQALLRAYLQECSASAAATRALSIVAFERVYTEMADHAWDVTAAAAAAIESE